MVSRRRTQGGGTDIFTCQQDRDQGIIDTIKKRYSGGDRRYTLEL
jgi:hypothetical protein